MDKKPAAIFSVFFLIVSAVLVMTYFRYVMMHDYIVEAEMDCDPYTELCFVYVCDPVAGEECTGNPEEDTSYYKIIRRNAKNIPSCDPSSDDCQMSACRDGEAQCEIILCDNTSNPDVTCNDPATYSEQNPLEEDSEEIDTEDEATDGEGTDIEGMVVEEGTGSLEYPENGSDESLQEEADDGVEIESSSESETEL